MGFQIMGNEVNITATKQLIKLCQVGSLSLRYVYHSSLKGQGRYVGNGCWVIRERPTTRTAQPENREI